MVEEARLEAVGSGLAALTDGWFVVNVRDAAWLTNAAFAPAASSRRAGPFCAGIPISTFRGFLTSESPST